MKISRGHDSWALPERSRPGIRRGPEAVYAALREAIVSGQLRPGDRLGEEELARQFQVSRTPIREAIFRLEAERLAERQAHRGSIVRGVAEQEVQELSLVRIALDGLAARLAATSALPADHARLRWLNDRLRDAVAREEFVQAAELNIQFHEALCEATRNGMLLQFIRQLHDLMRRTGATTLSAPGRAPLAVAEHLSIIEAIENRAPDSAEQRAQEHLVHAHKVRLGMLRQ